MKNMIVLTDNLLLPRMDLQESPITSSDFIFFTDGSYLRGPRGKYQADLVTVSPESILENAPLLNVFATQQSELTALTRACQLDKFHHGLSLSALNLTYALIPRHCDFAKKKNTQLFKGV